MDRDTHRHHDDHDGQPPVARRTRTQMKRLAGELNES